MRNLNHISISRSYYGGRVTKWHFKLVVLGVGEHVFEVFMCLVIYM